jgi:predicted dehydrogenase
MSPSMNVGRSAGKRLGVALIGPGRIATAHLAAVRAANDLAQLVAIAGLPEEINRTRELADRFGAAKALTSADAVFSDPAVDAVVLTVGNHLHGSLAIKALEAGKHVLVEKPLTTTVAECDAMIEAARRQSKILMAGQCRRYFKGAQVARERIGELGRPLNVISILGVFSDQPKTNWWSSAAATGGLALGLNGPHVVDTMMWWIGSRPTSVYAQTQRYRTVWEGEDEASLMISFEDGSMATGHVSMNMKSEVNERWIVGPKGMMRLVNDRDLWINGEHVVSEKLTPYIEGDVSFERQFREFAEAIREKRTPLASAEEVRPVVQVLEAAVKSAARHQPIQLQQSSSGGKTK